MISNQALFSATGNAFMLAWLALFVAAISGPQWRWRKWLLLFGGRVVPIGLLVVFLIGVLWHRDIEPAGSLFTFTGMVMMFSVPERLMNIWIEVLAYALLACHWIIGDAAKRGIHTILLLGTLMIAFISGGIGILVYAVIALTQERLSRRRRTRRA